MLGEVEGNAPILGEVADEFGFDAASVDVARVGETLDGVGGQGGRVGETEIIEPPSGFGEELEEGVVELLVRGVAGGGDAGNRVEGDALGLGDQVATG